MLSSFHRVEPENVKCSCYRLGTKQKFHRTKISYSLIPIFLVGIILAGELFPMSVIPVVAKVNLRINLSDY